MLERGSYARPQDNNDSLLYTGKRGECNAVFSLRSVYNYWLCCRTTSSQKRFRSRHSLSTRPHFFTHNLIIIIISIVILLVLTSSSQFPLKLPGHGNRWLLNWFKRLADGSHLSPRTAERQYFCFSACPLPFKGEMRSPSSARSLPPINHPLQSFLA